MAKNYNDILSSIQKGNVMDWTNALTRLSGVPLDRSTVYDSYASAVEYAATNAVAYEGQVLAVTENGDTTVYVITPASQGTYTVGEGDAAVEHQVYLKEVGSIPEGDNASIEVTDEGKITIKGFEAAEDARLPQIKVTKDAEGNETKREIEWVAIDAIVKGDGNDNTKTVVTAGTGITVTPIYNENTDTYTYTLDVALPTVPEYTIAKTDAVGYTTYQLKKDGTKVGDDIVVPDVSGISADLSAVKSELEEGDYGARIEAIEAFFEGAAADEGEGESLKNALDTLKEIQDYITADGTAAAQVLDNKAAIETLNGSGEGSVSKAVSDAISDITGTLPEGTTATLASLLQATADNAGAIADQAEDIATLNDNVYWTVDDELSINVNNEYPYIYANTLIKDQLVENARQILYIQENYAFADSVAGNFQSHLTLINENDQASKDRDAELEEAISDNSEAIATLNGDASTTGSVAKAVADAIAPLTDTATGIYATAVAAAATEAQNKVNALANGQVATNAGDISAINEQITGINKNIEGHSTRLGALEQADIGLGNRVAAIEGVHTTLNGTVSDHTTSIKALQDKDAVLEAAIAANTSKFDDYSTTNEVESKIAAAVGGIDNSAINAALAANATAIADEATRADKEEKRLAGLITANDAAIDTNAGEIARIDALLASVITNNDETALDSIKELADWVANHDGEKGVLSTVNANKAAIEKLNGGADKEGSVAKTVADAIAGIPAIEVATDKKAGIVKASEEIAVSGDGTMGILKVSTDKLIQGDLVLVLDGGTAEVATEQPEE